jgi:hypothetical protein
MANPRWASTSSTSFTTAANWDTGSAPIDGDNVYFQNNAVNVLTDLTNSAIEPASLNIDMSYTGVIGGTSASVNSLGANYLEIGPLLLNIGGGTGTGSGRIKLSLTADPGTVSVTKTKTASADTNLPPVRLIGTSTSNKHYQTGGSVGWAVEDPDETSAISEFIISGGTLILGAGVSWTTGYQTGGTVTLNSATAIGTGGTTYTQQGGTLNVIAGIIRNLTANGKVVYNGRVSAMSISGITRSTTTATATVASTATLQTGDYVRIMGADQADYNGYKLVAVASGTTFTFTVDDGAETPATGTMTGRKAIAAATVNGTLDVSGDIRNLDIAVLTLGPRGIIKFNAASPSHLHYGSLVPSNAGRITAGT